MKIIIVAFTSLTLSMSAYAQTDSLNNSTIDPVNNSNREIDNSIDTVSNSDMKIREENNRTAYPKSETGTNPQIQTDDEMMRNQQKQNPGNVEAPRRVSDSTETKAVQEKKSSQASDELKPKQTESYPVKAAPVQQPVRQKTETAPVKPAPVQQPAPAKSTPKVSKDKMYLVPDSTLKNKKSNSQQK